MGIEETRCKQCLRGIHAVSFARPFVGWGAWNMTTEIASVMSQYYRIVEQCRRLAHFYSSGIVSCTSKEFGTA